MEKLPDTTDSTQTGFAHATQHCAIHKSNKLVLLLLSLLSLLLPPAVFADKPALFLLNTYDNSQDVVGWVMSEKLDGVRGFWDGQQLLTRGGKTLNPPAWFVADYPPFAIDGELWTKRDDLGQIVSIVRRKNPDERWRHITHQIFEVPNQQGGLLNRLSVLDDYLTKHRNTPIRIVKQIPITKQTQVNAFLREIVAQGGEGIVLRDPNTPYQTGRLSSALKVKQHLDSECIVQKILAGKGKYTNKMGSILCQMSNGQPLKIGTGFSDADRENPPSIGSEITFKYYGLSKKGLPKYPVYLRQTPQQ